MGALLIICVIMCFECVFSQEEGSVDKVIAVDTATEISNGSAPTNGALNAICRGNHECTVNGSRCDPMTHTCKCIFLLVPLYDRCVNPTPIPHETLWIINHYIDLIIGLSVVIVALGSLLAPIKGKLLGERLYCGVRDKLRESRRSRSSVKPDEAITSSNRNEIIST